MIRDLKFADIKAVARLCDDIRRRSSYAEICPPLDTNRVKAFLMDIMVAVDGGSAKALVSTKDGDINGIFVGAVKPLYDVSDLQVALCLMWYTSEGVSPLVALRLAQHFVRWAEAAEEPVLIRLALTDAIIFPDRSAELLKKLGFRESGIIMEKWNG